MININSNYISCNYCNRLDIKKERKYIDVDAFKGVIEHAEMYI